MRTRTFLVRFRTLQTEVFSLSLQTTKLKLMQKSKILIVDDNEDVLIALNFLLKDKVEAVKVATNPERVEHFMKTFEPDVILLDMNFTLGTNTGQDGIMWLRAIKKRHPQLPVVLLTAYANIQLAVKRMKYGAADYKKLSRNLFDSLRELDKIGAKQCFVRYPDDENKDNLAVLNRLLRAAGFNVIEV